MVWVGVFERMCMCDIQHACLRKKPLFQCDPIKFSFSKTGVKHRFNKGQNLSKDLELYERTYIFSIPSSHSLLPDLPLLPPNKRRKRGDVV